MATNYQADVYEPNLKAALEYQDFICEKLHALGIVLQNMQSQQYQLKKENLLGLEIKFDRQLEKTGNIYIEIAEKANPANPYYVASGIYRDDNSWLFGIGDYEDFFIFTKKRLKEIDGLRKKGRIDGLREVTIPTSHGFLIPRNLAEQWCARKVGLRSEVTK